MELAKSKASGMLIDAAVADLVPTALNPRQVNVESESFKELKQSVEHDGVKIPVAIRPDPDGARQFQLLCGARRLAAAKAVGLKTIPAICYERMTDQEAFDMTFAENFGREDLTPIEQSRAVDILMQQYPDVLQRTRRVSWESA